MLFKAGHFEETNVRRCAITGLNTFDASYVYRGIHTGAHTYMYIYISLGSYTGIYIYTRHKVKSLQLCIELRRIVVMCAGALHCTRTAWNMRPRTKHD